MRVNGGSNHDSLKVHTIIMPRLVVVGEADQRAASGQDRCLLVGQSVSECH